MRTDVAIRRTIIFFAAAALVTAACSGAHAQEASAKKAPAQGSPAAPASLLSKVDFASGAITPWREVAHPKQWIDGNAGAGLDGRSMLPISGPGMPARGSHFSTVMRARDVFDVAAYPARAVAKLYRLDVDGKRQGTACTAQFVGPRHLLTAAHCLIDRSAGKPHPGFEIAIRYDGDRHRGILPVSAGWVLSSETVKRPSVVKATKPIDSAANCQDLGLIEVEEPVGRRLGWLGMSTAPTLGTILHRFSYPQESAVVGLERFMLDSTQPKDIRDAIQKEVIRNRLTEPDFSPSNLYYEYGPADQVHDEALSERNGAILPGRSGSALLDGRGTAVAVMSRATLGVNYSCRLTPEVIGAFARIAGHFTSPL